VPQVSVVVPAYNPGAFLARALDSVLAQTFGDIECIVVDDGSAEDLGWVQRHADPRVVLHRQPNRGVSVARNVGVALARSPMIAFLDQDDEWLPDKLARQMAAYAAEPTASFAHTGLIWVLPTGSLTAPAPAVTYHELLRGAQHVCLSSLLVPAEHYWAVGGHSPLLAQQQDFDLFLRLLRVFGAPVRVAEPLVRYHVHGQNASADYRTAVRESRGVLEAHRLRGAQSGDGRAAEAAAQGLANAQRLYAFQALDAARETWREGARRRALGHLRDAWHLSPATVAASAADHLRRSGPLTAPGPR